MIFTLLYLLICLLSNNISFDIYLGIFIVVIDILIALLNSDEPFIKISIEKDGGD